METLFKFMLIALIIVGGFTLMSHYYPQILCATFFHLGTYAISGGMLLIAGLFYVGIKAIN